MRAIAASLAAALVMTGTAAKAESLFPIDLGGPYSLTNQYGETRTEADPDGKAQLIFFGYANCPSICSAALPMMADVTDQLSEKGLRVTPVMITIDPVQDTVDSMKAPLAELHSDFIGLTGDKELLSETYEAFNVEFEKIFEDPEYGWIYSHSSLIHLVDPAGEFITLLPPILSADHMVKIIQANLTE